MSEISSTGVSERLLQTIGYASIQVPDGFAVHPSIQKSVFDARSEQISGKSNLNYATAEALAVGSLMMSGVSVRISGQDSVRGVYIERHARLVCQRSGATHTPFHHLQRTSGLDSGSKPFGTYSVVNSPLGEAGALAYEYGASLCDPNRLVIWEAQLGDFYNSAQSVVDGFICGSEEKWLKPSGLVMLLPHGYFGAGAEHSS